MKFNTRSMEALRFYFGRVYRIDCRESGSWLFNFEAWHERLLPAAQRAWKK